MRDLFSGISWVACAIVVVGCSSSSSSGGGGATSNTVKCGGGALTGTARATDVIGLGPIPGATVSAPGCTTATADDRGYVEIAVDQGFLMKLSASAPGYMNVYTEATFLKTGFAETGADYKTSDGAGLAPQLSSTSGYLFVSTGGDNSDGGPCSSGTGSSLSIDGHPELKAQYLKSQTALDPNGTATEGFGTLFGPMPAGTYSVTATKAGCKSVGHTDGYVQWAPSMAVIANTVTLMVLNLTPQ